QEIPGLAANPAVLVLFRLDDAVLTRSLWFLANPTATTLAPLLSELGDKSDAVALKLTLAPPRVAWARRFAAALDQRPRDVVEFQEAERWKAFEHDLRAFETARVAERVAE